jgi:glycosyltransferase involved in cell wall biosynthesis
MAVGGKPSKALLKMDNGRDIRVRGYVPDIHPYLSHADLTVAPLRVASGFQNKVALSLSMGVPVVATPQALKWMPEKESAVWSGGETPEGFAQAVLDGFKRHRANAARAKRSGAALRKAFSWDGSGRMIEKLLRGLTKA